ncbi:MAG: rRNA maturation RNase YbeY [Bacteroidota bacterium]
MHFPDFFEQAPPEAPVSFHVEDLADFHTPDEKRITDWLLAVASAENVPFREVQYIFCSDEYLREVNVEYLNHDYYTDIITFPYADDAIHGDLFISVDRVQDNAQTLQVSFEQELHRVMVHGVLHLAGYGDKTEADAALMRSKENQYIEML